MKVLVLNGPNLGRLGSREPAVYGRQDYISLVDFCVSSGAELGLDVEVRQTDREGQLVQWLEEAAHDSVPVVLNPAAFTHYSYAVQAAVAHRTADLIEVHLSNPHAREEFRKRSVISEVATGTIAGFGFASYGLALSEIARRANA